MMVAMEALRIMPAETDPLTAAEESAKETPDSSALRIIGWLSVGMAVAALGVCLGRELCRRSRLERRTPYDFYSHTNERQTSEFGYGM